MTRSLPAASATVTFVASSCGGDDGAAEAVVRIVGSSGGSAWQAD